MTELHHALTTGGIEAAKAVCHQVHAPLASIFHAGLMRTDKGLDVVEKTIINAGSIEMAFLERGLVWLATVISLAPMLGFTGTVQGMVNAFDAIAAANDISPAIVAEGISIALLTTLFGLVVAIIIQVFHNYFIAKIDRIVIAMEESAAEFLDLLIDYEDGKK